MATKIIDKSVYKAIRAFNERLRVARKTYGVTSKIVESMVTQARQVVGLEWTKDMKRISTGVKNQQALQKPFEREEFNKFIMDNSAANLLKNTVYASKKYEDIKKLKGAERKKAEEKAFAELTFLRNMYDIIWHDIYNAYGGKQGATLASQCYDGFITGDYDRAIEVYANGKINIQQFVSIVLHGANLEDMLNGTDTGGLYPIDEYDDEIMDDFDFLYPNPEEC